MQLRTKILLFANMITLCSVTFADIPTQTSKEMSNSNDIRNEIHLFNKIIAIVNDEIITLDQLNVEIKKAKSDFQNNQHLLHVLNKSSLQSKILDQLINEKLILQIAEQQGIKTTDEEVEKTINDINKYHHMTQKQLKLKLKTSNLNYNDYFQLIKKQIILNKVQQEITNRIYISSEEIDKYIQDNFYEVEYLVNNIVLLPNDSEDPAKESILKKANDIIKSIENKQITFSQAALQYSHSHNADIGGSLNWKYIEQLPKIYQSKTQFLRTGEISDPFIANNNIHIIQLESSRVSQKSIKFINKYYVQQIIINTSPIINDENAKNKLISILDQLNHGHSFSELARANFETIDLESNNGDPSWINLKDQPEELARAIQFAKLGEITKPFKVNDSWRVIKVLNQRQEDDTDLYQREQAMSALFNEKAQEILKNWIISLRDSSYIEIFDENFKDI